MKLRESLNKKIGIKKQSTQQIIEIIDNLLMEKKEEIPIDEQAKEFYDIIWKKASELTPVEILGPVRGQSSGQYRESYFKRQEDELFQKKIAEIFSAEKDSPIKRHVLILGRPLAGKTRMIFHWLKKQQTIDVLKPLYLEEYDSKIFFIPENPRKNRTKVLFLDDVHRYLELPNFIEILEKFLIRTDITILATCRSGFEWEKANNQLLQKKNYSLETIFQIIKIQDLDKQAGEELAKKVQVTWEEREKAFDGTIGSLILPLEEMAKRYRQCSDEEKTSLRAAKLAYYGGIYKGRNAFPIAWVKQIAEEKYELKEEEYKWRGIIDQLKTLEFCLEKNDQLFVEEAYFDKIIDPERKILTLTDFKELADIFQENPNVLLLLGNRTNAIANVIIKQKIAFKKTTIMIFQKALESWSLEQNPQSYALTQNQLGITYGTLGSVEEKGKNCKQAIEAFQEALKVYTLEELPQQYAATQNNLGNAYQTLGEVEDKAKNCQKAIEAFQEALKVYTLEELPQQYAATQ
ncbi:MAG: tetratricopeptide repeat protein, partial [Candidatus Heimdallarchaeota archaeon]|nr:tetratricopeptide repeat protein [Candidatus Heimdallarchaeota archaeon]